MDLAEAYYKVGYVQGMPTGQSLGRTGDAAKASAVDWTCCHRQPCPRRTTRWRCGRSASGAASSKSTRPSSPTKASSLEALPELDAAVAVFQRVAAIAPAYDDLATLEAGALVNRGDFAGHPHFPNDGRPDAALADYRAARGVLEAIPASSRHLYTERLWGITFEREGTILAERDDFAGARNAYTRSIEVRRQIVSRDDVNFDARRDLAVSYETFGRLLRAEGRPADALPYYLRARAAYEDLAKSDPANVDAQLTLAIIQRHIAHALGGPEGTHLGRRAEARVALDEALSRFRALAADDPENEYLSRTLAEAEADRRGLN